MAGKLELLLLEEEDTRTWAVVGHDWTMQVCWQKKLQMDQCG
jgi:hypothetical protein